LNTGIINIILITTLCTLTGCSNRQADLRKHYRAINGENTALLSITESESKFYGEYEIQYGLTGKDSGTVRGIKAGDTLRGVYHYRSFGGGKVTKPFILLRKGNTLKLGSGAETNYLNTPFYVPESVEFSDSNFLFTPLNRE
jgi:hypothetical protein